jgi:hypothetical protein
MALCIVSIATAWHCRDLFRKWEHFREMNGNGWNFCTKKKEDDFVFLKQG